MKIKCPVCGVVKIMKHAFEYHKLLEKIHEKIQDIEKKEFEIRHGYGYNDPEANRLNLMIKELKSLLENK